MFNINLFLVRLRRTFNGPMISYCKGNLGGRRAETADEKTLDKQVLLDALKKISETSDTLLGKLPARSLLGRFMKSSKK